MIRTRVLVGSLLALAAAGVLVGDASLAPWFPCLFACLVVAGVFATCELVRLLPPIFRPPEWLAVAGVLLTLAANWYDVLQRETGTWLLAAGSPWLPVLCAFTVVLLAAFLVEMYRFREPGAAVPRLALTVFAVAYLGLLGSCFARLRWLPEHSGLILTLTIFVPKCGDIGAFFTGRFLGRHRMTPILSPKKTWEGFAGGLSASVLTAVGLSFVGPVFAGGIPEATAFGAVVGVAGVLGDLAESLIKRDCQTKDAAKSIPGFGGLLDVIDSILFGAPVAYVWFSWRAA
ncbi:MAG TPA: phosphatidate cytidylyltransferase [Gemmataceae bacterium]|nr:phosphatidate cytidylyltransferase [Gemmataceae bacterium]